MVSVVFSLLMALVAGAHDFSVKSSPRLYNLSFGKRTSHLLILDHSGVDTTSFEIQSARRLVERSCEFLFDGKASLAGDARFNRNDLSLTARDTLVHLGLGFLGTGGPPITLRDAWREVYRASELFLTMQMDAYADALEHDHSLSRFGPADIHDQFHMAAQLLFETRFTNAALRDAAHTWVRLNGKAWFENIKLFRTWAPDRLREDNRGALDLNEDLSRPVSVAKLDDALVLIGEMLPTERTAANFWENSVSMFLRNVLRERYFNLPVRDYHVIRATLDWADLETGAALNDDAVADSLIGFDHWVDQIMAALDRGESFVVVDPVRAWPTTGETLLDRLVERGVQAAPVPLRGFRPQVVR